MRTLAGLLAGLLLLTGCTLETGGKKENRGRSTKSDKSENGRGSKSADDEEDSGEPITINGSGLGDEAVELLAGFQGSYLVAKGPEVLASGGLGEAREGDVELNDPNTLFRIGSCTKALTAIAVMQLVEDGKVRLDGSVGDYIEQAQGSPRQIHHLLSHSSGIGDYIGMPISPQSTQELIDVTLQMPIHFEPGRQFEYSNTNYAVLGAVIERASGESYAAYVENNILSRVDAARTRFGIPTSPEDGYATSRNVPWERLEPSKKAFAAGGMTSSVNDLHQILTGLAVDHSLVSQDRFDEMKTAHVANAGYGLFVEDGFVGHTGLIDDFTCDFRIYDRDSHIVIALSNGKMTASEAVEKLVSLIEE